MSNKEEIKSRIEKLRTVMNSNNIDCYVICDDDYHGSEYISDYFKTREYFSNFSGSNGKLLVTQDMAGLWTDGRYFIQAAQELKDTGIDLFKMKEKNVPDIEEYIKTEISTEMKLGLDGDAVMTKFVQDLDREIISINILDEIWQNRPTQEFNKIYPVSGDSISDKIKKAREEMKKENASAFLISKLDDIAWLFNLRGSDIEHTPVFFAYVLVTQDDIYLFVDKTSSKDIHKNNDIMHVSSDDLQKNIGMEFAEMISQAKITIMQYKEIHNAHKLIPNFMDADKKCINEISKNLTRETEKKITVQDVKTKVMVDMEYLNYALYDKLCKSGYVVVDSQMLTRAKSIKSEREIAQTKQAHVQDGVAMSKFIFAMKSNRDEFTDEMSVSKKLTEYRSSAKGFVDLSFPNIVAFAENAAIAHYETSEKTNKNLEGNNFLLIDSGNQFTMGTTDITRTFVVGSATDEMRKHYTLTLKSMMSLMWVKFKAGTKGSELDILPRVIMWEEGLDYNHGTGHGVGHLLCVHEGPNGIGKRYPDVELKEGNITTVEPGVYIEGKYGIRLENETLCVASEDEEYLILEPVTFCPFEREAIDKDMLTKYEIEKINKYNSLVYEKISPYLDDEEKAWLTAQTEPL